MNQKTRLRKKGVTLMEVIVAMAVYGIMGLLLVEIISLVNVMIKSTDQLNVKLSYEAKYADNLLMTGENGQPFTRDDVMVRINYNSTAGWINGGGTDDNYRASQFTTDYSVHDDTYEGTLYHEDTNYKFMTFDKVGGTAAEKPDGPFELHVVLDAEASEITKIEISDYVIRDNDGNIIEQIPLVMYTDPDDGTTAQRVYDGPFTNGQEITFLLDNNALETGDNRTTQFGATVTIYKNVTLNGYNFGEQAWADAATKFYTALTIGNDDNATTTYYTECTIHYLGGEKHEFSFEGSST